MKVIRFRRLSRKPEIRQMKLRIGTPFGLIEKIISVEIGIWEIAFNEEQLWAKLDGETAEIIMPGKSWIVRLWRKFLPLRMIDIGEDVME